MRTVVIIAFLLLPIIATSVEDTNVLSDWERLLVPAENEKSDVSAILRGREELRNFEAELALGKIKVDGALAIKVSSAKEKIHKLIKEYVKHYGNTSEGLKQAVASGIAIICCFNLVDCESDLCDIILSVRADGISSAIDALLRLKSKEDVWLRLLRSTTEDSRWSQIAAAAYPTITANELKEELGMSDIQIRKNQWYDSIFGQIKGAEYKAQLFDKATNLEEKVKSAFYSGIGDEWDRLRNRVGLKNFIKLLTEYPDKIPAIVYKLKHEEYERDSITQGGNCNDGPYGLAHLLSILPYKLRDDFLKRYKEAATKDGNKIPSKDSTGLDVSAQDKNAERQALLNQLNEIIEYKMKPNDTENVIASVREKSWLNDPEFIERLKTIASGFPNDLMHRGTVMNALYDLYVAKVSREYFWDNVEKHQENTNLAQYSISILAFEMEEEEIKRLQKILKDNKNVMIGGAKNAAIYAFYVELNILKEDKPLIRKVPYCLPILIRGRSQISQYEPKGVRFDPDVVRAKKAFLKLSAKYPVEVAKIVFEYKDYWKTYLATSLVGMDLTFDEYLDKVATFLAKESQEELIKIRQTRHTEKANSSVDNDAIPKSLKKE